MRQLVCVCLCIALVYLLCGVVCVVVYFVFCVLLLMYVQYAQSEEGNDLVVQSGMAEGTPTQQVTTLYNRVQDLGEELQVREIQARKQLRNEIHKQLPAKYLEIDRR